VVPDAAGEDVDQDTFNAKYANLPAKDLAYYPTPDNAADHMLSKVRLFKGMRLLEPSAGTGALIRALRRKIEKTQENRHEEYRVFESDVTVRAIEIHASRAAELRQREGDFCTVTVDNFLQTQALPVYDVLICNPPFSGTHFMAHLAHGLDHVKNGEALHAILPITAMIGITAKHASFHRWLEKVSERYSWSELPSESFKDSGTLINTIILSIRKKS
jgi:phospholipid N-methyltransferase